MASNPRRARIATIALLVAFPSLLALPGLAAKTAEWQADLLSWRSQRAQGLSAPDGWLTLVALDWLQPGPSAPRPTTASTSTPQSLRTLVSSTSAGTGYASLHHPRVFPQPFASTDSRLMRQQSPPMTASHPCSPPALSPSS
jgi:uncharacterized protein (DUF1684 family)